MRTNEELARHIMELAAAFHVRLIVNEGMPAEYGAAGVMRRDRKKPFDARARVVRIAPVTEECSYAVALHELGHCLSPLGMVSQTEGSRTFKITGRFATLRDVHLKLMEEEAAWEWARHHALDWTVAMDMVEQQSLDSYRQHARRFGVGIL